MLRMLGLEHISGGGNNVDEGKGGRTPILTGGSGAMSKEEARSIFERLMSTPEIDEGKENYLPIEDENEPFQ